MLLRWNPSPIVLNSTVGAKNWISFFPWWILAWYSSRLLPCYIATQFLCQIQEKWERVPNDSVYQSNVWIYCHLGPHPWATDEHRYNLQDCGWSPFLPSAEDHRTVMWPFMPHKLISAMQMAPDNPIMDEFLQVFGQQSMALIKLSVEMRCLFTALDSTNMSHKWKQSPFRLAFGSTKEW